MGATVNSLATATRRDAAQCKRIPAVYEWHSFTKIVLGCPRSSAQSGSSRLNVRCRKREPSCEMFMKKSKTDGHYAENRPESGRHPSRIKRARRRRKAVALVVATAVIDRGGDGGELTDDRLWTAGFWKYLQFWAAVVLPLCEQSRGVRIAGNQEYSAIGQLLSQFSGQNNAVHLRHYHITQNDVGNLFLSVF